MRVILFGATGMVGSGVLLECLDEPRIASVISVVRQSGGVAHPKLRELVHDDFLGYLPIRAEPRRNVLFRLGRRHRRQRPAAARARCRHNIFIFRSTRARPNRRRLRSERATSSICSRRRHRLDRADRAMGLARRRNRDGG